jgi:hypothetical protein
VAISIAVISLGQVSMGQIGFKRAAAGHPAQRHRMKRKRFGPATSSTGDMEAGYGRILRSPSISQSGREHLVAHFTLPTPRQLRRAVRREWMPKVAYFAPAAR